MTGEGSDELRNTPHELRQQVENVRQWIDGGFTEKGGYALVMIMMHTLINVSECVEAIAASLELAAVQDIEAVVKRLVERVQRKLEKAEER